MDGVFDLLRSSIESENASVYDYYLQSCSELRTFFLKKDSASQVVKLINALLNGNRNRDRGFQLLEAFVPQCNVNDLAANCVSWMHQCFKSQSQNSKLTYKILGTLIVVSVEFPEVRKEVALSVIPKFMESLKINEKKIDLQNLYDVLECLEKCLLHYGKSCGSYKGFLQKLIMSTIEKSEEMHVIAGRCYLNLCLVGPPSSNSENYKKAWKEQQTFLIGVIHNILNSLFDGVNEIQSYSQYEVPKEFTNKPLDKVAEKSPFIKIQKMTDRFCSLTHFLESMLTLRFPIIKEVRPDAVLSLVCRVLAVTSITLSATPSSENIAIITQIPKLHVTSLKLLKALIQSCRLNVLSHSSIICKLIVQTLKWTNVSDWTYGQAKPYSSLRVAAYDCLTLWLTITRSGSNIETYINEVVNAIRLDISYNRPAVVISCRTKKSKGKRQKNAGGVNFSEHKPDCIIDRLANRELCLAALQVLPHLISSASTLVKPKIHQDVQEEVVKQLFQIKRQDLNDLPIPYEDEDCRLGLYTALLSLVNNYHPQFPPPINYATVLFSTGVKDSSVKVAQFCSLALGCVERILHPTISSLEFPMVLEDGSKALDPVSVLNKADTKGYLERFQEHNANQEIRIALTSSPVTPSTDIRINGVVQKLTEAEEDGEVNVENEEVSLSQDEDEPVPSKRQVTSNGEKEPEIPLIDLEDNELVNISDSEESGSSVEFINEGFLEKQNNLPKPIKEENSRDNGLNNKDKCDIRDEEVVEEEVPIKKQKIDDGEASIVHDKSCINEEEDEMLRSFVDEVE